MYIYIVIYNYIYTYIYIYWLYKDMQSMAARLALQQPWIEARRGKVLAHRMGLF